MDLEFATFGDIVDELQRRNVRFVLVAEETTNSDRTDLACFGARADTLTELLCLLYSGEEILLGDGDEGAAETQ